jgi:hypothetical protein
MTYNHEANIRGEGKTVHVVFTSLCMHACMQQQKGGGGGQSKAFPPPPPSVISHHHPFS